MSDHIKSLTIEALATKAQQARAVKADSELKSARELMQVMFDQSDAISSERNTLCDEVKELKEKLERGTVQLKAIRKALKKEKRLLEWSEERFFTSTYNMMVKRAAGAGLDHKSILIEGLDDPIGQLLPTSLLLCLLPLKGSYRIRLPLGVFMFLFCKALCLRDFNLVAFGLVTFMPLGFL